MMSAISQVTFSLRLITPRESCRKCTKYRRRQCMHDCRYRSMHARCNSTYCDRFLAHFSAMLVWNVPFNKLPLAFQLRALLHKNPIEYIQGDSFDMMANSVILPDIPMLTGKFPHAHAYLCHRHIYLDIKVVHLDSTQSMSDCWGRSRSGSMVTGTSRDGG